MTFPASAGSVPNAFIQCVSSALGIKGYAQVALTTLQTQNVNTDWVFQFCDQMRFASANLVAQGSIAGLNAYATANIPGYSGTFTTDGEAIVTAIANCIAWVAANFPKDSQGFLQGYTLNGDGSRTETSFTPTQTAGLQTLLTTLIATIS